MKHLSILSAILVVSSLMPSSALAVTNSSQSYEQDFVITAYYSPKPDQCCYVKGSYEADQILNGNGTNGASGQAVYPGMIAAPASLPFGTRIDLPGIGIVGTVHDRGGAIVDKENYVRLDLWMGEGEEGLARALAFGVQRTRGTVYPVGAKQPAEKFVLSAFSAPVSKLQPYMVAQETLLDFQVKFGDRSPSVSLLQQRLQTAGYFNHAVSGLFGDVTQQSLKNFETDYGLNDEPSDSLSEKTAAFVQAAADRSTARGAIEAMVDRNSSKDAILDAKRTLRFLGYYKGRTTGDYDDALQAAILKFQQDQKLVADASSPGAGRIGPITKKNILISWQRRIVAQKAEQLLAMKKIDQLLSDRHEQVDQFVGEGDKGDAVKSVQKILADAGYFPSSRISGLFGPVTKDAVSAFQLQHGLIKNLNDSAAGFVGPATLATFRTTQREKAYNLVRAEGWQAL